RGDLTRLPGAAADLSLHLYFAAMVLYVGGMFSYFAFFAYRQQALRWLGVALVAPGALIHLGAIVARGVADSHYPLANMYEYSSMLSLVAVTVFLLMTLRWPVASLGGGVALFVVVALVGMGPEGNMGRHYLDRLRHLSSRPHFAALARPAYGADCDRGLRVHPDHALCREPLDRRPALVREGRGLAGSRGYRPARRALR